MAYTKNPQWKDYPDESTPVTAERLNHLEDGVEAAAATADIAVAGLSGKADTSHQHAAGDISSGTLDVARVPNLPASKVTSGTFDAARIPSLPGSKIGSGTIAPARLGSGTADDTRFLRGDGTWQVPPAGDGGVTDHGALTGLSDDDHPQYHNDARGDARYYTKTQVDTALTGKADASRGLPSGGSTGQVLVKTSGSDYAAAWDDPPAPASAGRVGWGAPPGRWFQAARSVNAVSQFGATAGMEYAVGVDLGPYAVDAVAIRVDTPSAAGSQFIIALRPVTPDGVGAPVLAVSFDVSGSGGKTVVLDEPVFVNGPYALGWVSIRSEGDAPSLQRSVFENNPWLWPLWSGSNPTATGHGPVHQILNTGITGLPLPDTVTVGTGSINIEGGFVPQIQLRKAAS